MNSREIDQQASRLAAVRDWGDFEDPRTATLVILLTRRENYRSRLRGHIQDIRHNLDALEQNLTKASPLLNDLGELQSRPAALETAVGGFAAADRALRDYLGAFPPVVD